MNKCKKYKPLKASKPKFSIVCFTKQSFSSRSSEPCTESLTHRCRFYFTTGSVQEQINGQARVHCLQSEDHWTSVPMTLKEVQVPLCSDLLFVWCFSTNHWVISHSALSLENEQMVQAKFKTNQVQKNYKMLLKTLCLEGLSMPDASFSEVFCCLFLTKLQSFPNPFLIWLPLMLLNTEKVSVR